MPSRRTSFIDLVLPALLVLPAIALVRTGWGARWVLGWLLVVNLLTYAAYMWDKRKARTGGWRVAEVQLHFLELLGGWPAAWMAQRWLRHKNAKRSYQIVFWLILFAWQVVAVAKLRG